MNPKIIGISGPSGGGKTTVAKRIAQALGREKVAILSTDDLHKYSRDSSMWELYTHFDPDANNIEMGNEHIETLKSGGHIWRSTYCHRNGHFEPAIKVTPKEYVINEGLHSFYTGKCRQLTDVKIYIETDEDLLTHWKVVRDVTERGQTKESVMKKIEDRQKDLHFIESQKYYADFIIWLQPKKPIECIGDADEAVEVEFSLKNNGGGPNELSFEELINKITTWK